MKGGLEARKHHASWLTASASSKDTALTVSILRPENIRPGTFQPVHELLEGFEGDALLAILQAKEA